jgi:hypothetical protein
VHERQPSEPEELEELEELGDEAIIAQTTAAHALQPRANVAEEPRSVVITEHPAPRASEPPRHPPPRSSAEATLVIRDRRALDEMRKKIVRRQQQQKAHSRNALYLWGALGLAAFVLGGVVAFLATDSHSDAETAANQARSDARVALPSTLVAKPAANSSTSPTKRPVKLDDLPVEHKR